MGAVEPEVVTSTPDAITRAIGVRPIYCVQAVGGSRLSAARWRFENLPPTREALPQSVLAYCAAGSARVTKVTGGRAVNRWPKVGSVTFDPGDGRATWSVDGAVEAMHIYLDPTAVQYFVEQHLDAASAPEIDDFFAIEEPWLAGYFQMLISELERFHGLDGSAESLLLAQTEYLLVRHLLRWHSHAPAQDLRAIDPESRVNPLRPALMRRVEAYVEANLAGEIFLRSLAGVACMSINHFIRSFRAASGQTPYQYVLEQRLRKASEMLRTGSTPVAAIAASCGFGNAAHFSMRFHARFGVSPSEYRRAA
jgi:AraC family transcriptional regulator